ncbi:hypothetical protein N9Y26_01080 [bacterium]|nr:hypothetical protein [bacterium]
MVIIVDQEKGFDVEDNGYQAPATRRRETDSLSKVFQEIGCVLGITYTTCGLKLEIEVFIKLVAPS